MAEDLGYYCEVCSQFHACRWTKKPPTEEGYYWLFVPSWNLAPEVVWVFNSGDEKEPCYEFNRMIDGYSSPDYVTAPTDAQWMRIPTQAKTKE